MFPSLLPLNLFINSPVALNIADFNQLLRENTSDNKDINDASQIYNTPVILLWCYPKFECFAEEKREREDRRDMCCVVKSKLCALPLNKVSSFILRPLGQEH